MRAHAPAKVVIGVLFVVGTAACSKSKSAAPSPEPSTSTPTPSAAPPPWCGEDPKPKGLGFAILDDATRAKYLARSKVGLVAVKYAPCGSVEIVSTCDVPGSYLYLRAPALAVVPFRDLASLATAAYGSAAIDTKRGAWKEVKIDYARIGETVALPGPNAGAAFAACSEATHVIVRAMHGAIRLYDDTEKREIFGGRDALMGCGAMNAETERADGGVGAPSRSCSAPFQIDLVPKEEAVAGLGDYVEKEVARQKGIAEATPEQNKAYFAKIAPWVDVAPAAITSWKPGESTSYPPRDSIKARR